MNINRVEVATQDGNHFVFRNRDALAFMVWYQRKEIKIPFLGVDRDEITSVKQGLYPHA